MTRTHFGKIATLLAWCCAGAAQAVELPAFELTLPVDSDTSVGATGSAPAYFRTIDGVAYFSAMTPEHGVELYRTDGTPGGAALVYEFAAGTASSDPVPLGKAGGRIIVSAHDSVHGVQLWAIEPGGSATRLSAGTFNPSSSNSWPQHVGNAGSRLLIYNQFDWHVWSTDGTVAGTRDLGRIGGYYFQTRNRCEIGGAIVLTGDLNDTSGPATETYAIVRTDGTAGGTSTIGSVPLVYNGNVRVHGTADRCYFLSGGNALGQSRGWTLVESDGTAAGTRTVASSASARSLGIAGLGGTLYLVQYDETRLSLLRRTPGTDAFVTVADIPVANPEGVFGSVSRIGDGLIGFSGPYASTSGMSMGYFVSDGTAAGTRRVFPPTNAPVYLTAYAKPALGGVLLPGQSSGIYVNGTTGQATVLPQLGSEFYMNGDTVGGVYVGAATDAAGHELWRSDGTTAGTSRLTDLWASTRSGVATYPDQRITIGDVVYVATAPVNPGNPLPMNTVMRSDGTPAGTRVLPAGAHPAGMVTALLPFGDGVAFSLLDDPQAANGVTWYRADAALTGAVPISGALRRASAPAVAGARILFGCGTWTPDVEDLCAAEPATGQTRVVYATMPGASQLQPVGAIGNAAIFAAGDSIWRSDGTLPGTVRLAATTGERYDVDTPGLMFNGKIYFGACLENAGTCRLLSTDGTAAGTTTVAALASDLAVRSFVAIGARFAFVARGNGGIVQLWSSDGSTTGTQLLIGLPSSEWLFGAVGGKAHLWSWCGPDCGDMYYVSDGTPAGTRPVELPPSIVPVPGMSVAVGDEAIVFSCRRASTGDELCAIDRDGEHARFLADVYPGPIGSGANYAFVGRTSAGIWLALNDGRHGTELWRLRALPDAIFKNGFDG